MLNTDYFQTETCEQRQAFITDPAVTPPVSKPTINQEKGYVALASWLFLMGALIFTGDSILEVIEGLSLQSILHLLASLFFTVGSILFIPTHQKL